MSHDYHSCLSPDPFEWFERLRELSFMFETSNLNISDCSSLIRLFRSLLSEGSEPASINFLAVTISSLCLYQREEKRECIQKLIG